MVWRPFYAVQMRNSCNNIALHLHTQFCRWKEICSSEETLQCMAKCSWWYKILFMPFRQDKTETTSLHASILWLKINLQLYKNKTTYDKVKLMVKSPLLCCSDEMWMEQQCFEIVCTVLWLKIIFQINKNTIVYEEVTLMVQIPLLCSSDEKLS